ncbi:TetR/AcrR family transcriptional regulator [Methylobacterium sp. D54C]
MGRKRTIDREAMLDAAERVVARVGAANLTLEAVAQEAGISKGSVLYDLKTKQGVIEAVVHRAFQRDQAHHASLEGDLGQRSNLAILGRIQGAATPPPAAFKPVALNLTAALALDEGLRQRMRAQQDATISRIVETSAAPRKALLAYLALEGLKFLEHLDFHQFPTAEREKILSEISKLAEGLPPFGTPETSD